MTALGITLTLATAISILALLAGYREPCATTGARESHAVNQYPIGSDRRGPTSTACTDLAVQSATLTRNCTFRNRITKTSSSLTAIGYQPIRNRGPNFSERHRPQEQLVIAPETEDCADIEAAHPLQRLQHLIGQELRGAGFCFHKRPVARKDAPSARRSEC
jgi:hypothetical protein